GYARVAVEGGGAVAREHREARAIGGGGWVPAAPAEENGRMGQGVTAEAVAAYGSTLPHVSRSAGSSFRPLTPSSPLASAALPKRFLLWVDGVGGYLVCLSNRVTFGQATGDAPVDVPLFADVSRL